ncbi:hypothetical protein Tco_0184148, partial [Tanacetum coccineum]
PSLASLGHNDPETPYTASGFIGLADSAPFLCACIYRYIRKSLIYANQNAQQDWNIVSWKLHGSSGVHTLVTEIGLVIHMLVEKRYPLRKEVLMQMLKLKLESEEDSTMAFVGNYRFDDYKTYEEK